MEISLMTNCKLKACTRIMRALGQPCIQQISCASVKWTAVHPVNCQCISKMHLPCACACDMWICHSHVSSNFLFTALFEMFSCPCYKTDDKQAYFMDKWELVHPFLTDQLWPVRHMYNDSRHLHIVCSCLQLSSRRRQH